MTEKKGKGVEMDRIVKDCVAPPLYALDEDDVFDTQGRIRLEELFDHLMKEGRLTNNCCYRIIREAAAIFREEPNVLDLDYPLTVCGDIHGQFFDLVRLFEVGGRPEETQYLFLGDYVDRGCFSTEVIFYMYALKVTHKSKMWMLRGNHECRQLTSFFNFRDECVYKYHECMYDCIMKSFDCLPISAVVNKTFFCVHGGLSPDVQSIQEIREIDRFCEVPREGPMCDLLWSDPYEHEKEKGGYDDGEEDWYGYNETRQCSYVFGEEAVKTFLKDNQMTSVIRAHEAQIDGYKMHFVNPETGIPRVITIFSAPNYCDVFKNKGACLQFDTNLLNIKQFVDSPHPYYLPNFMDVFQWSVPFVAEKVTEMLSLVLEGADDEPEPIEEKRKEAKASLAPKVPRFKAKVLAVTKVIRMYKMLRQNNEAIVQLKQLTPNHKLPMGLLTDGSAAIKKVLNSFQEAVVADLPNESYPHAPGEKIKSLDEAFSPKNDPRYSKRTSIKHTRQDTINSRTSLSEINLPHEMGEDRISLTLDSAPMARLVNRSSSNGSTTEDDDETYVPPPIELGGAVSQGKP